MNLNAFINFLVWSGFIVEAITVKTLSFWFAFSVRHKTCFSNLNLESMATESFTNGSAFGLPYLLLWKAECGQGFDFRWV